MSSAVFWASMNLIMQLATGVGLVFALELADGKLWF